MALEILIVDDEAPILRSLKRTLTQLIASNVDTAASGEEGLEKCHHKSYDIIISDLNMPGINGIDFLKQVAQFSPETIRIMLTAYGDVEYVLDAVNNANVWSYLRKPWDDRSLSVVIQQAVAMRKLLVERTALKQALIQTEKKRKRSVEGFIGESSALQDVYHIIEKASPSNASVFITGESGVGKEVAAQAIHNLSKRKLDNFIALNCAAIPSELMESEIFGHVKGAFSGAVGNRDGAATMAHNGTLFLDEIGEMDMSLQAKILRFIQTGTFQRVGSGKLEKVDVRFIAATNRVPQNAIDDGLLREDLFYRLNVISLAIPPLRERGDDILLLATHFMNYFMGEEDKQFSGFTEDAKKVLRTFSWPGNVRQLQNLIHSCVVMNNGPLLSAKMMASQLPIEQRKIAKLAPDKVEPTLSVPNLPTSAANSQADSEQVAGSEGANPETSHQENVTTTDDSVVIESLADIERKAIQEAVVYYEDNVVKAAGALGVSPSTLYRKIQQW